MKKYILFTLVLLGTSLSFAQEDMASTISIPQDSAQEEISVQKSTPFNLLGSITGLGYGAIAEWRPLQKFSMTASYHHEINDFDFLGDYENRANSYELAARTYLFAPARFPNSGVFIAAGYKLANHDVSFTTGGQSAYDKNTVHGTIAALGYRFHRSSNWIAEVSLRSEPNDVRGYSVSANYNWETSSVTNKKLETDYDRTVNFDLSFGYNF